MLIDRVINLLRNSRFPHSTENEMQMYIERIFKENEIPYQREFVLSDRDKVDFFVEGIAIECKVKSSRLSIFRQLERYSKHEKVTNIVLVTAKVMTLMTQINSKPTKVVQVGAGWL